MDKLLEQLDEVLSSDESNKVLVFTQYVEMINIIVANMKRQLDITPLTYTGKLQQWHGVGSDGRGYGVVGV